VHQITQHRPCGRLQRIALEQRDGESCEIAVEDNELPTRPEHPSRFCQRLPRVDQMRVDRVRDNKIKEGVRLSGYRSVADPE
jgi:hypothetical protein